LGNVTGADNTAIGASTLMGNAAGADNTALGYNALAFGSSGNDNVALGSRVLENNSGDNNIAVGFEAGLNLWTGFNNILIGNQGVAGDNGIIRLGTPGLHTNTFVAGAIHGDGGGLTNLNANNITSGELSEEQLPFGVVMNNSFEMATSIALGGNSHVSPDSYFCTALGYGASAEGFYTTALGAGASAVAMYAFAAGNNAYAKDVGAFVWGDASGGPIFYSITNNEFAVRATGGVRFVTGGTGLRIDGLVRGSGFAGDGGGLTNLNAAKLTGSLSNVDNIYLPASDAGKGIIYAGGSPLLQSSGNGNFFAGLNAGNLTMTGPGYNTAIGVTALHNNTSGVADTAVGCEALLANQTGTGNVAVGTDALAANVFGSNNIAVGTAAGGYIQGSFNLDIGNRGLPADNNIIRLGTPGTHTNTFIAGTIFGDGGGLTNVNAATVTGVTIQQNAGGAENVLAGSPANYVAGSVVGATIGGGGAKSYKSFDHLANAVEGDFGTVSGGAYNSAIAGASTVSGGYENVAAGIYATVSGGEVNSGNGAESTVSGGDHNQANGDDSTVSGGFSNAATGVASTVGGGYGNSAAGDYSFAAGNQAQATNTGAFVWADSSTNSPFPSTADNEFSIRAQNGMRIQADKGIHLNAADEPIIVRDWDAFAATAPASKAGIGRWGLFMEPTELTIGIPGTDVPNRYFQIAKYSTNGAATQLVQVDQSGNLTAAGTVTGSSDRNVKEHFNAVNPEEVLARVAAMPVSEWNYKADPATRHIGPMAQDFYAAFAVGLDDRHISMVDADGVALAAIQGLNQKLEDSRRENAQLKARLEKLEQMMTEKLGGAR